MKRAIFFRAYWEQPTSGLVLVSVCRIEWVYEKVTMAPISTPRELKMADEPRGDLSYNDERELNGMDDKPDPATNINLEDMIGDRLKQYYSKRLSQPLPTRFSDLLRELASKEEE